MRKAVIYSWFFGGIWLLGAGLFLPAWADFAALSVTKGPYLLVHGERYQVRIEGPDLAAPKLEWRQAHRTGRIPFTPLQSGLWEAVLPAHVNSGRLSYRIVVGSQSSAWITAIPEYGEGGSFRFAAYGDNREGRGDRSVHEDILECLEQDQPALVIHSGDLVSKGHVPEYWHHFFNSTHSLYSRTPFQPSKGNHDSSRKREFRTYFGPGKPAYTYYAVMRGSMLFIAVDTTISYKKGSDQYSFIEDTLAKTGRDTASVVYFHHSPFSAGKHGGERKVRKHLVPLFEKYGVDIVVSGHDHGYQRIGPVNGVLYLVTGGGGASLYPVAERTGVEVGHSSHHYLLFEKEGGRLKGWMKDRYCQTIDAFEINTMLNPIPLSERTSLPDIRSTRWKPPRKK